MAAFNRGPGNSDFQRLVDRLAPLYAQLGFHATFAGLCHVGRQY
jgi:hypothetical protein